MNLMRLSHLLNQLSQCAAISMPSPERRKKVSALYLMCFAVSDFPFSVYRPLNRNFKTNFTLYEEAFMFIIQIRVGV